MSDYLYLIPIVVAVLWAGWMLLLIRDARQPKVNDASLQDDRRRLRDRLAQLYPPPPAPQRPARSKSIRVHQQLPSQSAGTSPIRNPFNPNAYPHASPQVADPLPDPMLLTAVDRPGWEPPGSWSQPTEQATTDPTPEPSTACDVATSYDPGPASDGSLY